MLFEDLIVVARNTTRITDAVSILKEAGYFGGALDLCIKQATVLTPGQTIETAALRAKFIEGYHQALHDLYSFKERYPGSALQGPGGVAPDFGAIKKLVDDKILTEEEANVARKQLANATK